MIMNVHCLLYQSFFTMDIRKGEGFVVEFGWLLLVFFMLLFVFPFLLQFTILVIF